MYIRTESVRYKHSIFNFYFERDKDFAKPKILHSAAALKINFLGRFPISLSRTRRGGFCGA